MKLEHLRIFHAVASAGSFSRAQKAVGVRQPAISKAIKSLEETLGVSLLDRGRGGAVLTHAGEKLFTSCQAIFDEVERAKELVTSERKELRGDLRMAASEHAASYLLPPVLKQLRAEHAGVVPRVITGASHLLAREISDGRCELGLFFYMEKSPLLERREIAQVPCQVVVAREHATDDTVLETFIGSREIDDVTNKRFPTLQMLQKHRPNTNIRLSCNSLETHKSLVKTGAGISILPLFMVTKELRDRSLVVLHPDYVFLASLELVTQRGKILSRPAKAFLRLLKTALRN